MLLHPIESLMEVFARVYSKNTGVNIRFGRDFSTDGKNITIVRLLDNTDPFIRFECEMGVMHELGHIITGDFPFFYGYLENNGRKKTTKSTIFNVVRDVTIEGKTMEVRFPGLIKKWKRFLIALIEKQNDAIATGNVRLFRMLILAAYFRARELQHNDTFGPGIILPDAVEEVYERRILPFIPDIATHDTIPQSQELTEAIFEELMKEPPPPKPPPPPPMPQSQSGDENEEQSGDEDEEPQSGDTGEDDPFNQDEDEETETVNGSEEGDSEDTPEEENDSEDTPEEENDSEEDNDSEDNPEKNDSEDDPEGKSSEDDNDSEDEEEGTEGDSNEEDSEDSEDNEDEPGGSGDTENEEDDPEDENEGETEKDSEDSEEDDDDNEEGEDDEPEDPFTDNGEEALKKAQEEMEEDEGETDIGEEIADDINEFADDTCLYRESPGIKENVIFPEQRPDWHIEVAGYEAEGRRITGYTGSKLKTLFISSKAPVWHRNMRRGKLDCKNLWKAKLGSQEVCKLKTPSTLEDSAVYFIADNSGSMDGIKGQVTHAILTSLGSDMDKLRIPFEAIGFTTPWVDQNHIANRDGNMGIRSQPINIHMMKTFEESYRHVRHRFVWPQNTIATAELPAIIFGANRLIERRETKKVMFILTDGGTCTGNNILDVSMRIATKEFILRMKNAGIRVVLIGIMNDSVRDYDPEAIVLNDLKEFARSFYSKLMSLLL